MFKGSVHPKYPFKDITHVSFGYFFSGGNKVPIRIDVNIKTVI